MYTELFYIYFLISSIPIVLVGNKSDLHNDRSVSVEEGKALAREMKAIFLETSAKENQVLISIQTNRFIRKIIDISNLNI